MDATTPSYKRHFSHRPASFAHSAGGPSCVERGGLDSETVLALQNVGTRVRAQVGMGYSRSRGEVGWRVHSTGAADRGGLRPVSMWNPVKRGREDDGVSAGSVASAAAWDVLPAGSGRSRGADDDDDDDAMELDEVAATARGEDAAPLQRRVRALPQSVRRGTWTRQTQSLPVAAGTDRYLASAPLVQSHCLDSLDLEGAPPPPASDTPSRALQHTQPVVAAGARIPKWGTVEQGKDGAAMSGSEEWSQFDFSSWANRCEF